MRAKWEYGWETCDQHHEDDALVNGWEPIGWAPPAHLLVRRLVVARCEAGHDCDFDDGETCQSPAPVSSIYRNCGEVVVAVPVDPYDIAFGRKEQ